MTQSYGSTYLAANTVAPAIVGWNGDTCKALPEVPGKASRAEEVIVIDDTKLFAAGGRWPTDRAMSKKSRFFEIAFESACFLLLPRTGETWILDLSKNPMYWEKKMSMIRSGKFRSRFMQVRQSPCLAPTMLTNNN